MKRHAREPLLQIANATVTAPGGRPLFDSLTLRLAREHVALIGRNGVGKSTLLGVLADDNDDRVRVRGRRHFVPQALDPAGLSHGERRRRALEEARVSGAELLLLDEPTDHLDEDAVAWLRSWLLRWPGALIVASHDRRLLADFSHFLVASESGSRYFGGSLEALELELERDHHERERRHAARLHDLATYEAHTEYVARRKARKKRYGRCAEIDRGTPRIRLNQKREQAQVSHGRLGRLREAKLASMRAWSQATRRALKVDLPLELAVPTLDAEPRPVIDLRRASATVDGRRLFEVDLRVARERVGVVGANGTGKTTLLEVLTGQRAPASGSARQDASRLGVVEQGGRNWMLEESLLERLAREHAGADEAARLLVAHRFPLALARRPMTSLSPGERGRAALIALFHRTPPVDALVLDEPTCSLDLVGQRALTEALRRWPGGLVVASHDRAFLSALDLDAVIDLGAAAPGRLDSQPCQTPSP